MSLYGRTLYIDTTLKVRWVVNHREILYLSTNKSKKTSDLAFMNKTSNKSGLHQTQVCYCM